MDFKQVMIDKGEKVGLAFAGGLALLLVGLGAMTYMNNAFDPEAKKTELAKRKGEIERKIADQSAKPDPLEKQYDSKFEFDKVQASALKTLFFDPFAQPDNKRLNPTVVRVKGIQADALSVKIPAYDLQGIEGKPRIGVLEQTKKGGVNKDVNLADALNRFQKQRFNQAKAFNKGASAPPQGNFPGGGEGGPMGGAGPRGGGPPGGGPGMMGGGGMGGGFDVKGERMDIRYVDVDDEKGLAGKRLALTLYTQRLIVVQAAFPYLEQLRRIQESMKISNLNEFLTKPEAQPFFKGLNVQRREIGFNGAEGPWIDLKFEESYRPIFMRKVSDQEDDPELAYVKLHPANRLVMPLPSILPTVSSSKYPAIRLPELSAEIEKRKALNAPPPAVEQENKFKGQGDIFNPQGADTKTIAGGGLGEFGGSNSAPGLGSLMPPRGMMPPRGGLGGEEGGPGGLAGTVTTRPAEPLGYVMVRIVDADPFIQPGRKYQYRFQIKMENPNFNKPDLVSLRSDANIAILKGEWSDPSETVTVPEENFIYSVDATQPDPNDPKKTIQKVALKEGQALLQMHRWQEQVRVEKFKEPFGDWLVVDTVVTRGARVGGRQFVNLPLWSSEFNNFILRELKDDKGVKGKDPRRGVFLDLTRTDLFVVDLEGGRQSFTSSRKKIEDECAQEVLMFSEEDGSMFLRSSAFDRDSSDRKSREDAWKAWVAEVEGTTRKTATGAGPMGKNGGSTPFD